MLETLSERPKDGILKLIAMFEADPREDKVDLGVGVYRDASGATPVMRAVRAAERRLLETEKTKTYTGLAGDPTFAEALVDLVLGETADSDRVAAAGAPGGTGAVRQAFELVRTEAPDAIVWIPAPTWPNHASMLRHMGMPMREYRYFDEDARVVDFGAMMEDLGRAGRGDAVLLHGCCHNPTGANPTPPEWREVADLLAAQGALPLIDIAYQGFGDGLDADAAGTRMVAERCPESLIAASCSKNFGIYRERAGLLIAVAPSAAARRNAQGVLDHLNRMNFAFPPDRGARLVTTVLADESLRADWETELEEMRRGMLNLRETLADELRGLTGSDRFGFLARHRGMFSRIGATPEQVSLMRERSGIYMVDDGRLNIAGLNAKTVPALARAIVDAGV